MPFPKLDVVVWDDGEDMIASAVSKDGMAFLDSLVGGEDILTLRLVSSPEEFADHIPPGVGVFFLQKSGFQPLMPDKNSLQ
jgi:hypothetical protein